MSMKRRMKAAAEAGKDFVPRALAVTAATAGATPASSHTAAPVR